MLHQEYGPRGAEEEQEPDELWVDLAETDPLAQPRRPAPMASRSDPLGSWTGTPTEDEDGETLPEESEIPTQDADDL